MIIAYLLYTNYHENMVRIHRTSPEGSAIIIGSL
jgi:hypothetical protein